ncbi:hypothetical protein GKC70_07565 [Pseudomonas sp. REB1044]
MRGRTQAVLFHSDQGSHQQGLTSFKPEKLNALLIVLLTFTACVATLDAFIFKGTIATFEEFERVPGEFIYGGVFAPTFLGLKFHGSNGINGIAVFFAFSFMVLLALGIVLKPPKKLVIVAGIGMLCCVILVLGSGSRQAVFGMLLSFLCYLTAGKMTVNRIVWLWLAILFGAVGSTVILVNFSDYFIELTAKSAIMLDNITSGNWDGVSVVNEHFDRAGDPGGFSSASPSVKAFQTEPGYRLRRGRGTVLDLKSMCARPYGAQK